MFLRYWDVEYIKTNGTSSSRYYKWRGIYRLTWQVIAAKFRSFSVTINTTCSHCTKMCDIALAFGLPLTSYVVVDDAVRYNTSSPQELIMIAFLDKLVDYLEGLSLDAFTDALTNSTSPPPPPRCYSK